MMLQTPTRLHVDTRAPGDTMTVFSPPLDITPVERVMRWVFSVPQWVQLTGAIVALVVGCVALVLVWRNASAIRAWFSHRHLTTPVFWKAVIGAVGIVVLLGMAGGGAAFFAYSQHNNQFCISCHTLHDEVYQRFQQSKHHRVAKLTCHDCHAEPLIAETAQIVKWVLFRPGEVGPHAPVPRAVCANCHIQQQPDSTWQRIIATAGHSIHLQTDTARTLGVECLTCHGVTAHRFRPVAETCSQSGCHDPMNIRLGRMADQTSLHSTTCHQFTAPVPESRDSLPVAFAHLAPGERNCLGCHEMRKVIERFIPEKDPHKGQCASCHNPHSQTKPSDAFKTCTNAGCHVRPDTLTPFHRGIHARALADCGTCHQEHSWKVQGKTCIDCHQNIFNKPPTRFRPRDPVPPSPHGEGGRGPEPVIELAAVGDIGAIIATALATPPQTATKRDTIFSHATHRAVECSSCHSMTGPAHGTLKIRTIRDCQQCHHETTVRSLGGGATACFRCHARDSLPSGAHLTTIRTSASTRTIRRPLPFAHATHAPVPCAECHSTPVTLAAGRTCESCHAPHHEAQRECKTCHAGYDAHRGREVHLTCGGSGCHSDRMTLALATTRNVCLACHAAQADHKPGRDCATCHRVHWTTAAAAPGGPARRHAGRRE